MNRHQWDEAAQMTAEGIASFKGTFKPSDLMEIFEALAVLYPRTPGDVQHAEEENELLQRMRLIWGDYGQEEKG